MVEIGPGKGVLTQALLERKAQVTAIEIDKDLVNIIRSDIDASENTALYKNLTLIQADALRYPFQEIQAPYKVVANLPYYISTPLLFRLLEEKTKITQMVLMLQKEVAERIAASVGSKSYGALSIILQFFTEVQLVFTVSPNCFQPKPKVSSALISITPLKTPRIHVKDEVLFLKVVKGAFSYRRKRLSNALACAGFSEAKINAALLKSNCDGTRRGETLTISEFAILSDALFYLGSD